MEPKIFKGFEDHYPAEAVKYAMENRTEAIPELLEILEYTLSDVENLSVDGNYLIHFPATYILAYYRETRAYEYIIRMANLPDDQLFDLFGDTVTEDFANIIASVCDGNIEPIKAIVETASLNEYVRTQALRSLVILMNNGVIPRDMLVAYFKELYNGKLYDYDSYAWEELPYYSSLIHPAELAGDLDKAVADGKLSREDLDFVDEQSQRPIDEVLDELKQDENFSFINEQDVYSLERCVGGFHNHEFVFDSDDDDDDEDDDYLADDGLLRSLISGRSDFEIPKNIPVRRESFIGRNDPCPCGSGKKYKKCCLGK